MRKSRGVVLGSAGDIPLLCMCVVPDELQGVGRRGRHPGCGSWRLPMCLMQGLWYGAVVGERREELGWTECRSFWYGVLLTGLERRGV